MTAKTETATGNTWSYTYDIRNRMTGVTQKNSGGSVIYQAGYTYDALDRRIATTVNGTTTWTVYDGQNTYADFSGAGALKTRYLYGPAIDELLARTDSSGTTAWYLTDRLGSVHDLTSTSGTTLDHLAYDAYGNIISETNPSNADRFKWTAREWDGTTGLQFNRHRYYAPSVGRWTQLDPIGILKINANLYRSVGNSPLIAVDPFGLLSQYQTAQEDQHAPDEYPADRQPKYTLDARVLSKEKLTGDQVAFLKTIQEQLLTQMKTLTDDLKKQKLDELGSRDLRVLTGLHKNLKELRIGEVSMAEYMKESAVTDIHNRITYINLNEVREYSPHRLASYWAAVLVHEAIHYTGAEHPPYPTDAIKRLGDWYNLRYIRDNKYWTDFKPDLLPLEQ